MYLQQGDILIFPVDSIPEAAKPLPAGILHTGLNHVHGVAGKHELSEHGGVTYLKTLEPCRLTHTEHGGFEVPIGTYKKSIVVEYDHFAEESRQVID